MKQISKAILAVMEEVKGIDKTMTVGTGKFTYKGVPDQEVKKIIGEAMQKNGLCLLPTSIEPKVKVDRWEEESIYNGNKQIKQKQSVFTEVNTKYLLLHESGESIELSGYGQGVDAQDKSAGKATTYALKYAMLYAFLVPTGKIDDSDLTHSNDIQTPQPKNKNINKEFLSPTHKRWDRVVRSLAEGNTTLKVVLDHFDITEENKDLLLQESAQVSEEINKQKQS